MGGIINSTKSQELTLSFHQTPVAHLCKCQFISTTDLSDQRQKDWDREAYHHIAAFLIKKNPTLIADIVEMVGCIIWTIAETLDVKIKRWSEKKESNMYENNIIVIIKSRLALQQFRQLLITFWINWCRQLLKLEKTHFVLAEDLSEELLRLHINLWADLGLFNLAEININLGPISFSS